MSGACATCAKHDTCFYSSERVVDCIRHEPKLETNYERLFGTPERAARTIMDKQLTYDLLEQCDECPYQTDECFEPSGKCVMDEYDTLLEWLRGDAE